jgi:hypothetical protein
MFVIVVRRHSVGQVTLPVFEQESTLGMEERRERVGG